MRRGSAFHAAARSAFARAAREPTAPATDGLVRTSISPYALAFVAGFPGAIGGLALAAAMSRTGVTDGAFPLGAGLLLLAGFLLALGIRSVLDVGPDSVMARFFGLRGTTVAFNRLASATFGMTFPSISFGIALVDRDGRKVIEHANWWRDEAEVMRPIFRALVDHDIAMDRTTARVVSKTLGIPRPKPRKLHHSWFRHDRTW